MLDKTKALGRYSPALKMIVHDNIYEREVMENAKRIREPQPAAVEVIRKGNITPTSKFWFRYRNKHNFMGALGGGWQWGFGVEGGNKSVMLTVWRCQLRITWGLK